MGGIGLFCIALGDYGLAFWVLYDYVYGFFHLEDFHSFSLGL